MKAIAHMEALFLICAAVAVSLTLALEHPRFAADAFEAAPAQLAQASVNALPDA